jgi:hypothetical protein
MAMSSGSKQLLCFAAGVAVGVATTSIGEILMLVSRRPSSAATDAFEPAPRLDTPTADIDPDASRAIRQQTFEPVGAQAAPSASWD